MKEKLPQVRLVPAGIFIDGVPVKFVKAVTVQSKLGQDTEVTITFLAEIERHDADAG